mmetsp:Transcript_33729/g.57309  ORF Transcript_33729/g.57309 Transcript_33729/m.57309 type:complete len:222 (+) Transcript_33729:532-1197(+)
MPLPLLLPSHSRHFRVPPPNIPSCTAPNTYQTPTSSWTPPLSIVLPRHAILESKRRVRSPAETFWHRQPAYSARSEWRETPRAVNSDEAHSDLQDKRSKTVRGGVRPTIFWAAQAYETIAFPRHPNDFPRMLRHRCCSHPFPRRFPFQTRVRQRRHLDTLSVFPSSHSTHHSTVPRSFPSIVVQRWVRGVVENQHPRDPCSMRRRRRHRVHRARWPCRERA